MPAASAPFTRLARVYDAIMDDVEYDGWTEFLLDELASRGWPAPDGPGRDAARVLDLACGTGNSTRPLLERGYSVTGADASGAMLEVAREKLPHVPFHRTGFLELDLPERYHLVVCLFDSLNNLTDPADLRRALGRAHGVLEPGGWLVFDANTREGVRQLWDEDVFEGEAIAREGRVRFRWTHSFDPATELGHVRAECWDARGRFVEEHAERGYDAAELAAMLDGAGFEAVELLEYPSGMAPAEDAPRVWAFARRPPSTGKPAGEALRDGS